MKRILALLAVLTVTLFATPAANAQSVSIGVSGRNGGGHITISSGRYYNDGYRNNNGYRGNGRGYNRGYRNYNRSPRFFVPPVPHYVRPLPPPYRLVRERFWDDRCGCWYYTGRYIRIYNY